MGGIGGRNGGLLFGGGGWIIGARTSLRGGKIGLNFSRSASLRQLISSTTYSGRH